MPDLRLSALRAPFPWFGGKRRAAHLVWPRFGNVPNYVEPFFGSGAVLLARPEAWPPRNETVNDLDCYLANFWRALQRDPEAVARWADWPVNEADLHARHKWLHARKAFINRMHSEPDHCDPKIAGWWVWGISCWIGDNWCRTTPQEALPHPRPQGICALRSSSGSGIGNRRPTLAPAIGVHADRALGVGSCGGSGKGPDCMKRIDIRKGGRGVGRLGEKRPNITGRSLKGVHRPLLAGQIPELKGNRGIHSGQIFEAKDHRGIQRDGPTNNLQAYMLALAARLRRVRVCCGQWHRILGPSPTVHIGVTAVFLDPPYGAAGRDKVYNHDSLIVAAEVRQWCLEHGADPRLRIALCGYEGEHNELEARGWDKLAWKAGGGYGARNKANRNAGRERIWFSPGCLKPDGGLFASPAEVR